LVDRPLGDTLEGLIHDDLVRGLIFTDAKIGVLTHPQDPTLLQNRCFLLHVMGQGTGEWQVPVGGMGALVNALTTSAREAGARIVTRVTAERVYPGNPRHTIVFNGDGDERETAVEATRVLVNAGPNVFDRLLGRPRVMHGAGEGSVGKVNMLLRRLPRLTSRIDPGDAFRGTFHVDEGYEAMRHSYQQAESGHLPDHPPFEMYCHTLTDASILSRTLRESGHHTLTLFGLDVPYRLFTASNESTKAELLRRYLNALNEYLVDPIEDCLAFDRDGRPCLAITSPVDLERELALDRGNIFHGDVSWFFARDDREAGSWGVETPDDRMYRCGSSASRGGGVSGIPGHNAARRIFEEMGIAQT
jgi:phytoene dehydrogenase-like protein